VSTDRPIECFGSNDGCAQKRREIMIERLHEVRERKPHDFDVLLRPKANFSWIGLLDG
jgi:hypothetical protein